ncbi:Lrp/AsnC family transcriptional regulator [Desulfomicrobium escambiense]|uniref:Lrp/AsnC family transcriptional regulator n=1 Tax=Desulfomicrobium escambiense TaxID=29503 RepID=UPI00041127B3|nr:Lrp/AsnC family transcriptional regulator [Desulfomicrobium escambiense]
MSEKDLNLDQMDRQIIDALQKNGRESYKSIAQKLGVSDGTVRLRTERMIRSGYLRISASVNPMFFEDGLTATVGVSLEGRANAEIMRAIATLEGVQSVANVSGRFDLLVEIHVSSRNDLRRFLVDDLSAVGGIQNTETFLYLETIDKWVRQRSEGTE